MFTVYFIDFIRSFAILSFPLSPIKTTYQTLYNDNICKAKHVARNKTINTNIYFCEIEFLWSCVGCEILNWKIAICSLNLGHKF